MEYSEHMCQGIYECLWFRYGRRPTLLLTTVVEIITGIATSFSPNLLVYSILRFLTGSAIAGQFNAVYLIGELCNDMSQISLLTQQV